MEKQKDNLLNLIELEDSLIYLQKNQNYLIKNIEIFQKLIEDRYENEKLTNLKVYESIIERVNNLLNYLEDIKKSQKEYYSNSNHELS